jgi:hypothetical protein
MHKDGTQPTKPKAIFVFGSNTQGQHWGGAARAAADYYGAKWGKAVGLTGQAYAIPTIEVDLDKDKTETARRTLSLSEIKHHVDGFNKFAKAHPDKEFFVTRIGCAIAGHKDDDIGPLFAPALPNCDYPDTWEKYLK